MAGYAGGHPNECPQCHSPPWESCAQHPDSNAKCPRTIEHYDNNAKVMLGGYSGGASKEGAWGRVSLQFVDPDGTITTRDYVEVKQRKGLLETFKGILAGGN
jgi:hypothetical protein